MKHSDILLRFKTKCINKDVRCFKPIVILSDSTIESNMYKGICILNTLHTTNSCLKYDKMYLAPCQPSILHSTRCFPYALYVNRPPSSDSLLAVDMPVCVLQ